VICTCDLLRPPPNIARTKCECTLCSRSLPPTLLLPASHHPKELNEPRPFTVDSESNYALIPAPAKPSCLELTVTAANGLSAYAICCSDITLSHYHSQPTRATGDDALVEVLTIALSMMTTARIGTLLGTYRLSIREWAEAHAIVLSPEERLAKLPITIKTANPELLEAGQYLRELNRRMFEDAGLLQKQLKRFDVSWELCAQDCPQILGLQCFAKVCCPQRTATDWELSTAYKDKKVAT